MFWFLVLGCRLQAPKALALLLGREHHREEDEISISSRLQQIALRCLPSKLQLALSCHAAPYHHITLSLQPTISGPQFSISPELRQRNFRQEGFHVGSCLLSEIFPGVCKEVRGFPRLRF